MTLQVEFWTVVGFLITFMSFVGGMAKWLFSKAEERQAARFASLSSRCNSPPPTGASWKKNLCGLRRIYR
ncbi:putative phage-related exported protein [Escherichia coli]|jgi:hypothetical protein|uniref:Putative phage-related exported protein n=1 Tax=Escherichia coli TaxID=562 RepID=A0A377F6K8_ECOLX|nr:putative phage-related exported protein [Escherichia coli]